MIPVYSGTSDSETEGTRWVGLRTGRAAGFETPVLNVWEARDQQMTTREEELVALGWEKRFLADEPRLSEMKEVYESIGFEVLLEPLPEKEELAHCSESGCTACLDLDPDRYRTIYTRTKDPSPEL
jgi:hypothetical protein